MKICVVGPSKHFLSGITYFTIGLANELSKKNEVSVIHLKKLLPRFLFPGKSRVGSNISDLELNKKIDVYDGINWYWFPSMFKAISFLKKENPDVIIFQWWTGTVAHTYFLLKILNKLFFKKKTILEFHEVLDPSENNMKFARFYMKFFNGHLFKNFDAYICHSESDAKLTKSKYNVNNIFVVPLGSFNYFKKEKPIRKDGKTCNILFFGLIRPYKGLEYLIEAFEKIPQELIDKYHLTIVGEAWQCNPKELVEKSRYRKNITLVDRYVSDQEVGKFFSNADVVVLPYLRASQSGAAHIATSYGLPVIVSKVGGLKESMKDYGGAFFVKPRDSDGIKNALLKIYKTRHKRFKNPHSWQKTLDKFEEIFKSLKK
ncbi:MAG: glycosyltransferase [Nanoarchaeota archaeon]